MTHPWWKGAVVYQIYPRSYQDDNGDGIGDFAGIIRRLPHIAELGADAIWLSPFFTSPMQDMGYDVSDYTDVDPMFGNLDDFDRMLARAHELGLKVIIDQVLSHSSDQHPHFVESRRSRDNAKSDWYVWADARPDGAPPNNWQSIFGGSAWQWNTARRQYYLHNFLKSQPDFNFHHPAVQEFHLDVLRFWLDRGVDGFRLDTVNFYFHNAALTDQVPLAGAENAVKPYDMQDQVHSKNQPENLAFLQRMRAVLEEYEDRAMVGEIGDGARSLSLMKQYTEGNERLHMAYSFEMLGPVFNAAHFRSRIEGFFADGGRGWPSWSFSNHDVPRHVTRWKAHAVDEQSVAKLAIGMLASFQGTIGLYQGEELGQSETELELSELTDPEGIEFWPDHKGRDGCRTPMVWEADAPHGGFSTVAPWLPVKAEQCARAVSAQTGDDSVLAHYRAVLRFRRDHPILAQGHTQFIDLPEPLLAFHRHEGTERLTCVFNLSPQPMTVPVGEQATVQGPSYGASVQDGVLQLDGSGYAYVQDYLQ